MSIVINEINKPYLIDSLTQPLPLRHHWIFDAHFLDFTLAEINFLDETVGPTISLRIAECEIKVPSGWNILIVDRETSTVDVVPVSKCAAMEYLAFVFSPEDGKLITEPIKVIDWAEKDACIFPAVATGPAVIHSIAPGVLHGKTINRGIILSPHDLWRWIGGKTIGDILG
jgi:hypothetical protein